MQDLKGRVEMPIGERGRAITPSAIEEAFRAIDRAGADAIVLADGTPLTSELPSDRLSGALVEAIAAPDALAYGWARGERMLLEAVDGYLDRVGAPRRPAVVTAGVTQGVFLALYVLASPGDTVITDAATYCDTLTCCAGLQLHTVGVAYDDGGMVPDDLERVVLNLRRLGRRPAAIYLIPTTHNPFGVTLSAERRRALVTVARRHNVPIVEDETYALFDMTGAPPLAALAPELVVRLDSVSKIFGPGLRVGWMTGPPEVMQRVEGLKAAIDVCAPVAMQRAVAHLLPEVEALARPQLDGLAVRRAALLAALDEHFSGLCTWTHPRGGYFVWLQPGIERSGRALWEHGLACGVAVLPGAIFSPDGRDDAVRLSCANRTPEALREGVARLRTAYDEGR